MIKIGIAGVGGIGSNVAFNLVRSNINNLKIVDFDIIEESNLNRQFYFQDQIGLNKVDALEENLKRINNDIKIEKIKLFLDENNIFDVFKDCNIIVEGFDKIEQKKMLIEKFAYTGKFIISACGVAGLNIDRIDIKKLQDNIFIVGDFTTDIEDKKLFSPKVIIIASMMANLILNKLKINDDIL